MKTTALGIIGAGLTAIELVVKQGHSLTDWQTWAFPAIIAMFGCYSQDHKPTP